MTGPQAFEADVVIIGSGIAGAMCAYMLAKKKIKVLVLEAGPRVERADIVKKFTQTYKFDFSSGFPNVDWAPRPDWQDKDKQYFEHTGPVRAEVEYLRVVGGTTWHWSAGVARLIPSDLKLRSTYGVGYDWPIDYDHLEPWYSKADYEMGVAGDDNQIIHFGAYRSKPFPLPPIPLSYSDKIIAKGLESTGITFLSATSARNSRAFDGRSQCMGFGTCSPICPSGAQYGAMVHVAKAEKLGVRILDNTRVDRIVADKVGKITEVRAKRSDGKDVVARGKIFLLAANGIESPRLLLMSADESHPKGLANSSGRVGRNFYEHPGMVGNLLMPEPVYPRGPEGTMANAIYRDGPFRKTQSAWALGVHNSTFIHEAANDALVKGLEPPALDSAIRDQATRRISINTQMEQLPQLENGMSLDWTRRDSAGQPVMKIHYSLSDYERASFEQARDLFKKIATALSAQLDAITGPWVHHHPMGMVMMGSDPKTSVVDAECRSHNHKNLFVVSGAVFPASGIGGPTLTIAALAIRASEDIAKQLRA